MSTNERKLISREPWWAEEPGPGRSELDVRWGWLEVYDDNSFNFDQQSTPPTAEEILARKGCRV